MVRRSFTSAALAAMTLWTAACHKPAATKTEDTKTVETAARPSSVVAAGDPKVAGQLVAGFYGVEAGAWRWSGRQFAVQLGIPQGAAQRGGKLSLRITVPPPVIEKLGSTTLSASIGAVELPAETYTKAGEYTYQRDIEPGLLAGDSVRVDFRLDRVMPPAGADLRELGVIAQRVSLEAK